MENLGTIVLAVGALGTAAFGIVEALKWTRVGLLGFDQITKLLGEPVMNSLRSAYGPEFLTLLRAEYRSGRADGELPRTIRQGVRVGLNSKTAGALAGLVGAVEADDLTGVAGTLESGESLSDKQRSTLGRFELALDARIDAALALADDKYVGSIRVIASLIAILIAVVVGFSAGTSPLLNLVVGLAAVPIAPIAKDLSKAIQSAGRALPGTT